MSLTRRLVSGTLQLTLSSVMVRLMSVVTMPILTSLLSPEAYGEAALVGTIISLMSVLALAGIDMSYARAYRSTTPPNGLAVELFAWRFALAGGLLAGISGSAGWYFWIADSFALNQWLAVFLGVGIVLSVASTMAQVRARLSGSYRRLSVAIVMGGALSVLVSIGVAASWRQDAMPLILAALAGYAGPLLALGMPRIDGLVARSGLDGGQIRSLVRIGLAGVITAPMYWILSSSDRWFIGHYQGADAVGIYSIGCNIALIGVMVNSAVLSVWLPEAAREYEQDSERARGDLGRLLSRLVAGLALVWLAVTAAGGDVIRWLADERFHAAADYVPWIAAGVFFYGVAHLANVGLLLAKRLKWSAVWWLVGGVLCMASNAILVPRLGGSGAALTQALSFGFIAAGILGVSQRIYSMVIEWRRLVVVAGLVAVMGVAMAPPWHAIPVLSLLVKVPVGILAVLIVARVSAADWLSRGVDVIRHRLRVSSP